MTFADGEVVYVHRAAPNPYAVTATASDASGCFPMRITDVRERVGYLGAHLYWRYSGQSGSGAAVDVDGDGRDYIGYEPCAGCVALTTEAAWQAVQRG